MTITPATWITIVRLLMTPFIGLAIFKRKMLIGGALFIAAALTDILDGWIARSYAMESFCGALLDPVADKWLMLVTFFSFCMTLKTVPFVLFLFVFLLCLKEAVLLIGYIGASWYTRSYVEVKPILMGKITMALEFFVGGWLFYSFPGTCCSSFIFQVLLCVVVISAYVSLGAYCYSAILAMRK